MRLCVFRERRSKYPLAHYYPCVGKLLAKENIVAAKIHNSSHETKLLHFGGHPNSEEAIRIGFAVV
jgi:hypothetical protein